MEESIKIISDMIQGIFGLSIIVVILCLVLVFCLLWIVYRYEIQDKEHYNNRIKAKARIDADIEYRILSLSHKISYLQDELNKINSKNE